MQARQFGAGHMSPHNFGRAYAKVAVFLECFVYVGFVLGCCVIKWTCFWWFAERQVQVLLNVRVKVDLLAKCWWKWAMSQGSLGSAGFSTLRIYTQNAMSKPFLQDILQRYRHIECYVQETTLQTHRMAMFKLQERLCISYNFSDT